MSDIAATRVWLIEDNDPYREAVSRVVNDAPDLACPAAFASCEEALAALKAGADAPDILLLDVGLPGMSGIEGIPLFRAAAPGAKVVVLTVFHDDDKIFRAICHGAIGYLLKMSPVDQIIAAIRDVQAGGSPMDARIARRVLEMFARLAPARHEYGLTGRERDALELLVQGFGKKQIAARLGLSIHTVDTYIRKIYEKLHVHNRSSAVAKAVQERIV